MHITDSFGTNLGTYCESAPSQNTAVQEEAEQALFCAATGMQRETGEQCVHVKALGELFQRRHPEGKWRKLFQDERREGSPCAS